MGNVAPYDVLTVKTPLDVMRSCAEIVGAAGQGGGYILSTGGLIGRGTPPENVDALISAAAEYGKYPLTR
jgi:uroporphyrinogen-III decarboxylase